MGYERSWMYLRAADLEHLKAAFAKVDKRLKAGCVRTGVLTVRDDSTWFSTVFGVSLKR